MLSALERGTLVRAMALVSSGLAVATACGARSGLDLPARDLGGASLGSLGLTDGGRTGTGTGSAPGGDGGGDPADGSGSGSSGTSATSGSTASVHSIGSSCVGGGVMPPSCAGASPGLTGCGACDESCCATFEVTGVTYYRTYMNDGSGPTGETDLATVSSFVLDRYLVTVGRFRQFVSAWNGGAGYMPAVGSGLHTHLNGGQGLAAVGQPGTYETGWQESDNSWVGPTDSMLDMCAPASTWTPSPDSNESLPINCINLWEAYAFCIWDGGFLPSEAEWELAAAGGTEQREYPWGTASPGTNNEYAIYGYGLTGCYFPTAETCDGAMNIAPVGTATRGAGLYGQLDMAGNVAQWTLDWFAPYVDPSVDAAQLEPQQVRSIRGGAYHALPVDLVPWYRAGRYAPGRTADVGFRCARVP